MSLLCGSCRLSGAAVEKTLALPQLQLVEISDSFYDPSYLAVICSSFAFGVQDSGLFWVMTSGNVAVFSAYWFNTGYMFTSVYGSFWKIFIRFRPSYFSGMLGSTADSCSCVRLVWKRHWPWHVQDWSSARVQTWRRQPSSHSAAHQRVDELMG